MDASLRNRRMIKQRTRFRRLKVRAKRNGKAEDKRMAVRYGGADKEWVDLNMCFNMLSSWCTCRNASQRVVTRRVRIWLPVHAFVAAALECWSLWCSSMWHSKFELSLWTLLHSKFKFRSSSLLCLNFEFWSLSSQLLTVKCRPMPPTIFCYLYWI